MAELLYREQAGIAWITLNRPQKRNALSATIFVELARHWARIRHDPAVRAVVLSASGEEDFCCGGDLVTVIPLFSGAREPQSEAERTLRDNPQLIDAVMLKDQPLGKPLITAINGRALGGGMELLLASDLRLAVPEARFALPEAQVGIVPGGGGMSRVLQQLPRACALQLLLTGEPIDAARAEQIGLINEVVSRDQLLPRAQALAERLATNAPLALQAILAQAQQGMGMNRDEAFALEQRLAEGVMSSEDAREGPRAFAEKRAPRFQGR